MTQTLNHHGLRPASGKPAIELGAAFFRTSTPMPVFPSDFDSTDFGYPMDENDSWGDCVLAGMDHWFECIYRTLGLTWTNWTKAQLLTFYRTQNPDFDPDGTDKTNGPGSNADGGMDIQTFLEHLVSIGLLVGFGAVSHANMEVATYVGLGVVTGEELVQDNEQETVWDVPGGPDIGGHCTVTVAFPTGPLGNSKIVSWGAIYYMTPRFVTSQVSQIFLPICQAQVDHPGFRDAFDLAGFAQAYTEITGRPFPAVVPTPAPPAPPVPVTPPTPSGPAFPAASPLVAAHIASAAHRADLTQVAWLERHLERYFGVNGS